MTDSTPPTPARLFRGLTTPQALVILGVLALAGWLAYVLPEDTVTRVVLGVLTLLGVAGTALPGPGASAPAPAPSAPPPPPAGRRSGHAHLDALLWLAAVGAVLWTWLARAGLLGAVLLVLALPSCGSTGSAKPILDTTCAGARVACRLIDSACSAYTGASSGGEAP